MVASVRWPGSTPKLMRMWAGTLRIVLADKVHLNGVHNIVTGEVKYVHVVRFRFNVDRDLEMTPA